jgi:2Fe-2S ferredoxin
MIKLNVKEENKTIEFEPNGEKSILDACLENDIHIDHACGSNAACSTCHIKIKIGMNLNPEFD